MRRLSGFTLIEILVVLFIVSMLTGLVVANLPGFVSSADYEEEMMRLKFALDQGLQKAEIDASEVGVVIYSDGYEFLVFDETLKGWLPALDRSLRKHQLPDDLMLLLSLEDEPIRLGMPATEESVNPIDPVGEGEIEPNILLLSSGETSVFRLELMNQETFWIGLSSEGYGDFTISRESFAPTE
ncbi:MAG: type II secretion system protein GspH [Gammaproteobacteria bacterium TMED95]|jgi:general secretion pathway protein H|nr:type II secretion system protein GspH [Gammaproteobacteria bacterium]OUV20092.1 MAG: type II secretion system protein GspH [Gammaproteobacteria bacterium TMED95]|tara:strand:- start:1185 stop:1736 length:552 start_codon:yes stop_codon:yes gene_type:complete